MQKFLTHLIQKRKPIFFFFFDVTTNFFEEKLQSHASKQESLVWAKYLYMICTIENLKARY